MSFRNSLLFAAAFSAAASLSAKLIEQPVAYEHDGVKLEGFLVYDDGAKGTAPGVVLVHEWWGLNDFVKQKARDVAALGYVAFALDMYGKGVGTEDPKKAGELAGQFYGKPLMAERAKAGLQAMLATKRVNADKVAAIGFCFGGSTAQVLAYSGAPVLGIVSFHGSPVPPPAGASTKAKLLMLHGAADPFVPKDQIEAFKKGVSEAHFDWQWVDYADAVHAFTNPGADAVRAKTGLNGVGYNEPAARRSWGHMRLFLRELFGQ